MELTAQEIPQRSEQDPSKKIWEDIQDVWENSKALRFLLQKLRKSNQLNFLNIDQRKFVILHIAEQLEHQIDAGEEYIHDVTEIHSAFLPHERQQHTEDFVDTYASMMKTIWEQFPSAAQQLSHFLALDAQMVDPSVYLKSLADIIGAPNVCQYAKDHACVGLSYQASFGLLPYIEKSVTDLEAQSTQDALSTLILLETTAQYGRNWNFSEDSRHEIQKLLSIYAQSDIPVLLRRKAASFSEKRRTDLLSSETSRASIRDQNYSRATILPISTDHLGVYHRSGDIIGILPRHHHGPYTAEDIIHLGNLETLQVTEDAPGAEKDRKEAARRSYTMFLDYNVLKALERDYGFPVTELTTREQLWFVTSLDDYHAKEENTVRAFTKTFGITGARAFLATEFGDSFRKTILDIAERFPEADARKIFEQFSEIVTFAQETAEQLGRRFFVHDRQYNVDSVRAELLSRAKDLLVTAELTADVSTITSSLERFKSDIVLFASMFKVTQKGQEVKFEDIRDVRLESMPSNELTEMDQQTMERLLTENWNAQAPELTEGTLKSLQDSFSNSRSRFFILRKGSGIAAFVRFDEQDDGSLYAGSLNVNTSYRSAGIGEAMLQSTIDTLAKDHIITAHVPAHLPVAMKYVNEFGLMIVGIDEEILANGAAIRDLQLKRDDSQQKYYGARPHVERFDISLGDETLLDMVAHQASRGYVGTGYTTDPLNPHLRFIAFEPKVVHSQHDQAA